MTEKFDICFTTEVSTPEARAHFFATLPAEVADVIDPPVWMMQIRIPETYDRPWLMAEPIEILRGWTACLYPHKRSSNDGAWLITVNDDCEDWTLSISASLLETRRDAVLAAMWSLSDRAVPCLAGREYSMGAVRRRGDLVVAEATRQTSMVSYAVVRRSEAFSGWSVLREDSDRIFLARPEK